MSSAPELVAAGIVSYLNALPLVDALERMPGWRLHRAVPAELLGMLETERVDLALLPIVDLARRADILSMVSDACISADGPVHSVVVHSRLPLEHVRRLAVDTESHTSIVLAQLIWLRRYERRIELVDRAGRATADAQLVIGDKAIATPPPEMPHRMDLAQAWKELTGLPMVFAAWACRHDAFTPTAVAALGRTLSKARDDGEQRAASLARDYAARHGWPAALAEQYLGGIIKYRIDHRAATGMRRFLHEAREERLL